MTCNGILKYPDLFDVIVLEEAGTVATGVAYPCMRGARAAVLTGDPRQLLPFHARNDVQASSHLERFIDAGRWRTAFLNTTYRFGPATVKVLNQLVYKTPGKQLVAAREERRGVSELRWFDCQVESVGVYPVDSNYTYRVNTNTHTLICSHTSR